MAINFNCTKEDNDLIRQIVSRAKESYSTENYDQLDMEMDITAAHCNGMPLDLEKFFGFPDFDFFHDIFGIHNHLSRKTGKLGDFFLPRCARPTPVKAGK